MIFISIFSGNLENKYSNAFSKESYLENEFEVSTSQSNYEFNYDTFSEDPTTRSLGGTLEWSIDLADEALSTPAICDLNPSMNGMNDYYEVVVASSDDKVCAVYNDGKLLWEFNDCVIDDMTIFEQSLGYEPPPFFGSVLPIDIAYSKGSEIIIGEEDALLCLNSDGTKLWNCKCTTDGTFLYTGAICDLEGDYQGIDAEGNDVGYRNDLEYIFVSHNEYYDDVYLECWQSNSQEIFRYKVNLSLSPEFLTGCSVTAELDGYFFLEDNEKILKDLLENDPDTLYTDIILTTTDFQRIIFSHEDGQPHGQYTVSINVSKPDGKTDYTYYGLPAVANLSGSRELECVAGFGYGSKNWTDAKGGICVYNQYGKDLTDPFLTGPAPSAVYSSPAICDAQMIREKNLGVDKKIDYEVYFGCDNGKFYCLQGSYLTELWSYQTGGRILSSPAVCNINSGESLEVVVGSDDGFVYCFEADPKELDLNGKPHPRDDGMPDDGGEKGDYDILWKFDTTSVDSASGKIGISSPIIGDIDFDGELEVLIGDTGGTLYCISAGGYCAIGQIDWPMFHYDLNKTGFYRPKEGLGVDIQLLKGHLLDKDFYNIMPGQTKTYNILVKNLATYFYENDIETFWLEFDQDVYSFGNNDENHKWPKSILTGDKLKWGYKDGGSKLEPYLVLKGLEQANLTLNITAPWNGDLGEFLKINIFVQSANKTYVWNSLSFSIYLDLKLDFEAEILIKPDISAEFLGKKVIELTPTEQAYVGVQVNNLGNMNDSYHLALEGNTYGWEIYFNDTKSQLYNNALELDASIMKEQFPYNYQDSEGLVYFTVKPPPDGGDNEVLTLKLKVTSVYSNVTHYFGEIIKIDYLYIIIDLQQKMELTCSEPRKSIGAGETAVFKVNLTNHGDSKIEVKISNSQLDYGWDLRFLFESIEYNNSNELIIPVEKESISHIYILITAPEQIKSNTIQTLTLFGTTSNFHNLITNDSIELSVIIDKYYSLNASVSLSQLKSDPGSFVSTYLEVANLGNIKDVITMSWVVPDGKWKTQFLLNKIETETADLAPGQQLRFQVKIFIPNDCQLGGYDLDINITGLSNTKFIKIKVIVNKVENLSLYGLSKIDIDPYLELNSILRPKPGFVPGDMVSLNFQLTNNGNSPSKVKLDLESLYPVLSDIEPPAIEWREFEKVNWWATIYKISNYEIYSVEYNRADFNQEIDMFNESYHISYLNIVSSQTRNITLLLSNNQTVWLQVKIQIPEDLPSTYPKIHPFPNEPWCFRLSCESTDENETTYEKVLEDNRVIIKLDISYPDLAILNISIPKKIVEGSKIKLNISVVNVGDMFANNVVIALYIDNQEIDRMVISKIDINVPKLITFIINYTSVEQNISVKVDPDNEIIELNEKNNEKNVDISNYRTANPRKTESPEFQSYILITFIIIILVIFSIIMVKHFHRKTIP